MLRYGSAALLLVAAIIFVGTRDTITAQTAPAPTFTKDVLPIVQKNCQSCHRPGQIGPFSMLTYESTRPWARSIKAKVVARQMPPWFADPAHGTYSNDRSLKQEEIDIISRWVDAGAPQGNPADAPKPIDWSADGWLIQPDVVVRGPEFRVPAKPDKNVIEWSTAIVPSGFTKDTWVTSIEFKPSDLGVTHHICFSFVPHRDDVKYYVWTWNEATRDEEGVAERPAAPAAGAAPQRNAAGQGGAGGQRAADPTAEGGANSTPQGEGPGRGVFGGGFNCYVPGVQPDDYRPFQAAKLIPANSDISIQVHYTPIGKEVVDRPLIGFTVADAPPEKQWISYNISGAGPTFAIPPNESNYASPPAQAEFGADAWLVQMMPHMHLRGKSMTYKLIFPDGREQIVLNVPKYDFNWQIVYNPVQPIFIPKGTKLHVDAIYDNSTLNKFNPNPTRTVYPGRMTWEEMMSPFFAVMIDGKTDPRTVLRLRGTTVNSEGA